MKISENVKKVLIVFTVVLAVTLLIVYAGPYAVRAVAYLFSLLSPFVFGYIIARAVNPIADKLKHKLHIPRGVSALLVMLVTLIVISSFVGLLGYKLFDEIRNLYFNWDDILSSLRNNWGNLSNRWGQMYIDMPDFIRNGVDTAILGIYKQCSDLMKNIPVVDMAQVVAKSLPSGLIWTIMFFLSLYFMVTQDSMVSGMLHKLLGEHGVNKVNAIKAQCKAYLGGYVKAQLILMAIVFLVVLVILSLFDVPFSLLVAAITAVLDALPFFGSGLVLGPLAVVYFINGNIKLGIVYIATYLAVMFLRRFIEPKLVSDRIGLNPLITLVTMYIGYKFWGVIGLITGPLLLMLIISLYKVGLFTRPIRIVKQLFMFIIKQIRLFENYISQITK